jgi:hypothetical protein
LVISKLEGVKASPLELVVGWLRSTENVGNSVHEHRYIGALSHMG